jgi:hypothetical protein
LLLEALALDLEAPVLGQRALGGVGVVLLQPDVPLAQPTVEPGQQGYQRAFLSA